MTKLALSPADVKEAHAPSVAANGLVRRQKIEVVPYSPAWPRQFEQQLARIRRALKETALSIEHVGSTAVPGLAAKPAIDIHLAVRNSADEAVYGPALEQAGFRCVVREPDWFEHRMYKGLDPEVNLHVFSEGCPELERCRFFRDWLRVAHADRVLYSQFKQALALLEWDHVDEYADAKRDIIDEIMSHAEACGFHS